jgi:hypothetical protein
MITTSNQGPTGIGPIGSSRSNIYQTPSSDITGRMNQGSSFTNIDTLVRDGAFYCSWFKNSATKGFFDYLRLERESLVDRMRGEESTSNLLRLQGELRRLDKILELPSTIERLVVQKR